MSTLRVFYFNAVLPIRTEKQKVYPKLLSPTLEPRDVVIQLSWPWYRYLLSRSNEFCIHKPSALLLNGLCLPSAIRELLMADLKRQHFCVTFCLKLGRTVPSPQDKKPGFTVTTQKQNSSYLSGKAKPLHVRGRKVRCENKRNLLLQLKRLTSNFTGRFLSVWRKQFRRKCP